MNYRVGSMQITEKPTRFKITEILDDGTQVNTSFQRIRMNTSSLVNPLEYDAGYGMYYGGLFYRWNVDLYIGDERSRKKWRKHGRKPVVTGTGGMNGLMAAYRHILYFRSLMGWKSEICICGNDSRRKKIYSRLLRRPHFYSTDEADAIITWNPVYIIIPGGNNDV